jgi:two-component system sensor histidine kinase PilS (NtrC family)
MDHDLDGQLRRLMGFRVVMVTTLLFVATYVGAVSESASETLAAVNPIYVVIGVTYALTVVHGLALRLLRARTALAYAQIVGDLLVITALVYFTSGLRSGFLLLYPMAVLAATVLVPRQGALWLAGLATALYAALILGVRSDLLSNPGLADVRSTPVAAVAYPIFVLGVVCATVALLGSYLAESLRHTGRQLLEVAEEVADLRELNQLIVDSIQSGLLTTDGEGRVLHANAFGQRILGRTGAELRGTGLRELFGSPLLGRPELRARARDRTLSRLEASYVHPDGRRLDLGVSVTPLASEAAAGGCLVVFQDLTDIRQLEDQVRTKEKLAAVGEMAAQLAHEIRNPLGSIRGSAQVLMSEPALGEEQAQLLGIISRESKRLSDTLNRFLYQARTPAHRHEAVDLRPVIESAVTLLRNASELSSEHSVRLECDEGPHVCLADADQIAQVFWNLARNALEAMPDGGRLDVALRRSGDEVVLTVRDEGRGLGRDEQKRVFAPFQGVRGGQGGLGLAIVFRIVREHGGDISVRSAPAAGTEIDVRLPAVPTPASAVSA